MCLNFLRPILFSVAVFVFLTLLEWWQIQTSSSLTFYNSAFSQLSVIFVLFMYDNKQILGRKTSTVVVKHLFAKWPLTCNSVQLFQNNYQQDDTYGLSFISRLVVLHSICFELQGAHHQEFTFFLYRQSLACCVIFCCIYPFSYVFCSRL